MITHARDGLQQPNPRHANAAVTSPSLAPSSVHAALHDPDWWRAMEDEFQALQDNHTWSLVTSPASINMQVDF
jgi:hypothetical protein